MRENALRHERARIEADGTGSNQVASAQRKQICGARARADEVHCHSPSPSAIAAVAVRSCEVTRIEIRRALRPALASAVASAIEPVPNFSMMRSDRVGVAIPVRILAGTALIGR